MKINTRKIYLFLVTLIIGIFFFLNHTSPTYASTNLTLDYLETKVAGGAGYDQVTAVEEDHLKNLYVLGLVGVSTMDFDPGSGVDSYTSAGGNDFYLTKYNADGSYAWTKKWGGTGADAGYNIAFDSSNNIYIASEFSNTIDLNPNAGVDSYTSPGSVDISLIKLYADGSYAWSKVMGSTSHDRLHSVQIASSDDIYLAGKFNGTVDFDPSGAVDNKSSNGNYEAYFTKFNADGSYAWTKTWGGADRDTVNDFVIGTDGNFYLAGVFRNNPNFDTGLGSDVHTSVGLDDAYLTKYNSDGSYAWTKTWGGTTNDFSFNIRTSPVTNDIYIVGSFQLTVDFDPSGAVNNITSVGSEDSYVSKFGSDGSYKFTYTWGGSLMDELNGITFDKNGNYYLGGFFNGTIDFDPTSGTDIKSSSGPYDQFFSAFDSNDNYILSKTFGSSTDVNWFDEVLYDLYASDNKLYLGGEFNGTTDFNTGSPVDSFISNGVWDSYLTTYVLDSILPTITSVSSNKTNGTYGEGEVIDINVTFSELVTSTGNVTVTLETGTTDRSCNFTITKSLTGSCNYTIQAGDSSSDLSIKSISGTIKDLNTNLMTNFVPLTTLESSKDIVIYVPVAASSSSSKKTVNYLLSSSSSNSSESETRTVVIKVEDKDGKPVEGAKVELHSEVQTAYTNKDGIATFNNVVGTDHEIVITYGITSITKKLDLLSVSKDIEDNYNSTIVLAASEQITSISSTSSRSSSTSSKVTSSSNTEASSILIVLIIALGIIVALVILVVVFRRNKKNSESQF